MMMHRTPHIIDDIARNLTIGDYDYVREQFNRLCIAVGIEEDAVAYFGNVHWPGISDMDAAVVGDEDSLLLLNNQFTALRETDLVFREVFWHIPVYLRHEAIPYTGRLHSFYGLEPTGIFEQINRPTPEDEEILHVVWWSFLLIAAVGILRACKLSLRRLLMIQKNLETSEYFFKLRTNTAISDHKISDDIRSAVINDAVVDMEIVWRLFVTQLQTALTVADHFFKSCHSIVSYPAGCRRVIMVNRSTILVKSNETEISDYYGIKVIRVPSQLIGLTECFTGLVKNTWSLDNYMESVRSVKGLYSRRSVGYPFICPFAISAYDDDTRAIRLINTYARALVC